MSEARKLGPFDVGKQLGVGGMGIVYLATYRDTGEKVALKILAPALCADKKLISRFEREIDILKKLEHPNIVRYFGGGRAGDQRYYAMEYMDGGSLDTILERKGRLSWEQTIRVGLQLCSALEHAHNHGIVHRDLKPGNLFISKKGRLRLGDFGIARDNDATALTAAGKTVGTYAYMAPEQIHGKHPIGAKTDLYAMGCLLYQFLTGSVPFPGDNAAEMFMKHLNDPPDSVCEHNLECPIWLDRVIQRLLAKEPDDRPYDALAVHTLLEDVRTRVSDQASMASHAMTSGPVDTVATEKDRADLHQAIGKKKKKKKKKKVPFWETTWFLMMCLGVVVGAVAWKMWPLNEQELFEKIAENYSNDPTWTDVDRILKDIDTYQTKFEDGPHKDEISGFKDQIEMDRAESRALARVESNDPDLTEAEAKYVEAKEFEDFGDRLTAVEHYEGVVNLFEGIEKDRAIVNLAKARIKDLQAAPAADGSLNTVNAALQRAETAFRHRGARLKARGIWQSVVRLYKDNRELGTQIQYARDCLEAMANQQEIPPLPLFAPPTDDTGNSSPDTSPGA